MNTKFRYCPELKMSIKIKQFIVLMLPKTNVNKIDLFKTKCMIYIPTLLTYNTVLSFYIYIVP